MSLGLLEWRTATTLDAKKLRGGLPGDCRWNLPVRPPGKTRNSTETNSSSYVSVDDYEIAQLVQASTGSWKNNRYHCRQICPQMSVTVGVS